MVRSLTNNTRRVLSDLSMERMSWICNEYFSLPSFEVSYERRAPWENIQRDPDSRTYLACDQRRSVFKFQNQYELMTSRNLNCKAYRPSWCLKSIEACHANTYTMLIRQKMCVCEYVNRLKDAYRCICTPIKDHQGPPSEPQHHCHVAR